MQGMRLRLLAVATTVALATPIAVAAVLAQRAAAISTTPAWTINLAGWDRSSSPTIADVNGDGIPDVVFGHQDARVRVLSGATGAELPGWPQYAVVKNGPAAIDSTPAVADLDGNGRKEIVVGVGSTWVAHQNGGVVVFNANGTTRCRFLTHDVMNTTTSAGVPDGYADGVFSSPAIGDITGDGHPDIVFGSFDHGIYAIDRFCHQIFRYDVEDTVWSSPALYDVDGDGRDEILIGNDQFAGGWDDWSGGEFRVLKWTPTGAVQLWIHKVNDTVWSSPAIGDIDGDGRVEVVVGAGTFYHRSDGYKIFAWHADDGSTVPHWPVTTAGTTGGSPALGDLNGDGIPEVVEGGGDGIIRAYHGNGTMMWSKRLTFNNVRGGGAVSTPIIADLNGDGHNDVGVGNDWGFFALNGSNAAYLGQLNTWLSHESAGAVGNFGPAGWKLITIGFNTPGHSTRVQAYDMPAPGITPPWPMFRRDPLHHAGPVGKNLLPPGYCRRSANPAPHPLAASSHGYWVLGRDGAVYPLKGAPFYGNAIGRMRGAAVAIAATHTGLGYYVLDAAGDIIPFGDARSHGSMVGKRLNAPIIAMAPTPTGRGYWLLGRDGGIFTFGDAQYHGSTGGLRLNKPIISMASTSTGHGYWLLGADGGVFTFGDAAYHGSTGGRRLAAPVISMATAPSGAGYWLVASDGGVFSFNVPYYGSLPGTGLCRRPTGTQMRATLTGHGYFVVAADGRVFPFGDALGGVSAPPLTFANYAVDLTIRP
jgi:hypothetical protein